MYNFVLQILVFSSLGLVIYLLAQAVPRVEETETPRGSGFFDKLMKKLPMAKIDKSLDSFFAKFLRKVRVVIMKLDNFINHRLGKLKKKENRSSDATQDKPADTAQDGPASTNSGGDSAPK